jgi:ribosomal protein S1
LPPRLQATKQKIPEEYRDPWEGRIEEFGEMEGRVPYEGNFEVGQVVEGTVEALTLRQGIFVDVGADYDANVFVDEFDWDKVLPLISIDQKVKIKVRV